MDKKGASVWVSAVLYFGVGIVILTLVMTAGMPVIDRMRDKNIAVQTKDVFHSLDDTIREVAKEGPGSQRVSYVDIRKGEMHFDVNGENITWDFRTTAVLSEPGVPDTEGNFILLTETTEVEDEFLLQYALDYKCKVNLKVEPVGSLQVLTGDSKLIISNLGTEKDVADELDCTEERVIVSIREA